MFTQSHDYLITDEQHNNVVASQSAIQDGTLKPHEGFKKIWAQARRVLDIIIWIPLPKAWKAVLSALIAAGDVVAGTDTIEIPAATDLKQPLPLGEPVKPAEQVNQ